MRRRKGTEDETEATDVLGGGGRAGADALSDLWLLPCLSAIAAHGSAHERTPGAAGVAASVHDASGRAGAHH